MTRNLFLKLLSLFLAFLVWLFVTNISDPTKSVTFSDIKIQVVNEDSVTEIDKVFDIISDETVTVKVTERKSILQKLTRNDFTVVADMENLTSMNTVPLTVSCSNASVGWEDIEIMPSSMKVQLEQIKQSEFVVTITTTGTPEKGYEVGKTSVVQGKTVQIAGAESLLNRIGQVVANVTVSNLKTDQRLTVRLRVYDKNGDEFTDAQMSRIQLKDSDGVLLSDNSVSVDVTMWEVMYDIPVQVEVKGTPASGYRIASVSTIPVTINLVGTQEALARLSGKVVLNEPISVDGISESFSVEYDLTETLSNYSDLRLVADADPVVTVSVQVEQSGDYTVMMPLSSLEVLNRPENMTLTFSPADQVAIVLHSDTEQDRAPGVSDLKASIDLSVCTESGSYEIPVEVIAPDGYYVASTPVLVVTAEKQETEAEE